MIVGGCEVKGDDQGDDHVVGIPICVGNVAERANKAKARDLAAGMKRVAARNTVA